MKKYSKTYTRENCLIAFQIWEKQSQLLGEKFGGVMPYTIFDAYNGVVSVYADSSGWEQFANIIADNSNKDSNFVPEMMRWYGENLDKLEKIWKENKVNSREELISFYELAYEAWVGLAVSYVLPDLDKISKVDQDLGMALRQRSADFLELTDHVLQNTLHNLYPDLGDLVKYISIEEVKNGNVSPIETLKEREKHYIYFGFRIYTNKDIADLSQENNIEIIEDKVEEGITELKGQTAMKGRVIGRVRVLKQKSEIPHLLDGEVLVTAMTTPDYLPAMHKATAFVTDEGGITCHAAIVAREIGKPCVIGTKLATKILNTGDMVEVDADKGIVRII
jgi:phosphohistidine swiveling domain-containing protein